MKRHTIRSLPRLPPVLVWSTACSGAKPAEPLEALGPFIDSVRVAHGVPGLGLTVSSDQAVLACYVSGVRDNDTHEPIDPETAFEAAAMSRGYDADGISANWKIGLPLASSTLHTTSSDLERFGIHLATQLQVFGRRPPR